MRPLPPPVGQRGGPEVQRQWDLWHLRTLFPAWGDRERDRLLRQGTAYDARQQELFADPVAACRRFAPAARRVLELHPGLYRGLTVSLHLGPYSLAPVPWLLAGHDVHVLVNRCSLAGIKPIYDHLQQTLNLPGTVVWVPIEGRFFALRLGRALRSGRPVFAYLDGNDGLAGSEGTLRHGIRHSLPGRDLRVRTGLARLAIRLRSPVHSLVTVWGAEEGFDWYIGPTWRPGPGRDAESLTHELFTWGFEVITRHPAQWRAWNMLTGSCDSFRRSSRPMAANPPRIPDFLSPEFLRRALCWRREVRVWPGDMLEDVQADCFYTGEGLTAAQVADLSRRRSFTAAGLVARWDRAWVGRHLPRLFALGIVGFAAAQARGGPPTQRNPG